MKIIKILVAALLVTFGIFIALFFAAGLLLNRNLDASCREIKDIASDPKVITYLDRWVSSNILDRGYTSVFGMHGGISATREGQYFDITALPDSSITRIPAQHLRFNIETISQEFDIPITSQNVSQIEVGLGRNHVILLKNGKQLSSYRGHDVKSGHLVQISNTVYAYCADARFEK